MAVLKNIIAGVFLTALITPQIAQAKQPYAKPLAACKEAISAHLTDKGLTPVRHKFKNVSRKASLYEFKLQSHARAEGTSEKSLFNTYCKVDRSNNSVEEVAATQK